MTGAEVAAAIASGSLDGRFGLLREAMKNREATLDVAKAGELKPGDEVKLQKMRPKYVCGMRGIVMAIDGTRVEVDVPELAATRYARRSWLNVSNVVKS